jgi:hypothetical protein
MTWDQNLHIKSGSISAAEALAMTFIRARIYADAKLYEAALRCVRSAA